MIWKRYYSLERYWPESVEQPRPFRHLPERAKTKAIGILRFSLFPFLPLLLAFDGILNFAHIFHATNVSFSNLYDTYLQVIGIVVIVTSLLILTWADSFLARSVYGAPPEKRVLVRRGPYRYVRHPVYLSFILFGAGLALVSSSYLMLITSAYLLILAYEYKAEDEREMLGRYGSAYREYMKSTGAFLPKFSTLIRGQTIELRPSPT